MFGVAHVLCMEMLGKQKSLKTLCIAFMSLQFHCIEKY